MKAKFRTQTVQLIALLGLLGAILGLSRSLYGLLTKNTLLNDRIRTLRVLQNDKMILEKQLMDAKKPEFIEREARNKLNLSKEGETVILIDTKSLDSTMSGSVSQQNSQANWKQWWNLFF